MHISEISRLVAGGMLLTVSALTLTGCDYWPPALQAQIEQLKTEAQQAATERASLEEQLNTATKVRNDLQARVEDLAKANDQLAARVSVLELDLVGERKKVAHLTESGKKAVAVKTTKVGTPPKDKKKPASQKSAKPPARRAHGQ